MIKYYLKKASESLPPSIIRHFVKADFLTIYYHVISDERLPWISNLYSYKTPAQFEDDLRYLKKYWHPIDYSQLEDHFLNGNPLPAKAVLVTFDDGFTQCFTEARPLLIEYEIPCVFFISPNYLDSHGMAPSLKVSLCVEQLRKADPLQKEVYIQAFHREFGERAFPGLDWKPWLLAQAEHDPNNLDTICKLCGVDLVDVLADSQPYMTSDQVRNLAVDGFTIGSHSIGHERFAKLSPEEAEENIRCSIDALQKLSEQTRIPFSFPFSADGVSRLLIREIKGKIGELGLLFDTNGMGIESGLLVKRFCGDRVDGAKAGKSNLPHLISKVYIEAMRHQLPA